MARTKPRFGLLDIIEWIGNKLPEPAILFVIGAIIVMVISHIAMVQAWEVQPKKLVQVMQVVVDGSGQPVIDPETGEPKRRPLVDDRGRIVTQLVDDLSRNEGQPIRSRGLLTGDGLYWALSSMVDNFVRFPPLGIVLVGMLGIGVAERTGFIGSALKAFMLVVPKRFLTPTMVFLGIMSSLGTDAGYVVLPPVAAALYKSVGRSPLAGIAAVFAGVSAGFNANLMITSLDPLLAGFTGPAAQTVDPAYNVNPACNWWFMIASTIVITAAGWITSDYIVEKRLSQRPASEGGPGAADVGDAEAQRLSRREIRGLWWAAASVIAATGIFVTMTVMPGAPLDDYLRAPDGSKVTRAEIRAGHAGNPGGDARIAELMRTTFVGLDLAKLADPHAGLDADLVKDPRRRLPDKVRGPGLGDHFDRWVESIVPMLFILFLTPGVVYGVAVGKLRRGRDVAAMMVDSMAYMAPIIVLAFFAAQFIEYFKFSNLDKMLAYTGGEMLATAGFTPGVLMVAFVLVTMFFNLFVGSMSAKYAMFAPIFVPMFMLVGVSPELTQAAYRIGDSTTNTITPLNAYLVIILVVMQKYAPKAGMGTLIAMMMPYTIVFTIVWLVLLLLWMQAGIPLGIEGPLTYVPASR